MNRKHDSLGEKAFDACNYTFLALFAIVTVLPFIYIIAGSFATEVELTERKFFLFPRDPSISAYQYIFSTDTMFRAMANSVIITVFGTATNLAFTLTMAYSLSRRDLLGRNAFMNMIIFTMLFSGGMIPSYLIVKELGLLDRYAAVILPGAISAFNLIVIKNFFQNLPAGLEESARIDGCTDLGVLWRIVLPLSKPIIATFGLFYAVGHWNNFFSALLFLNDHKMWPLQVMLREIVMLSQMAAGDINNLDPDFVEPPAQSVKMAVIVVGTVPILMVYPFLQKHFAKGVLLGSIKG
ncbi:carbohydrate ABC transporter permease [Paenibacillus antri]|uniref:Carbohydrate ABC transporter permease n=1 Tax=Paenibacillus antri TaxID=2582848 RepID=A0A5R9G855_9BACL|nr:carbohydrate ABC transporter permease [Paenibacillus antri]TLS49618.1 carbohydrate ABC transporter permease [Paenibacillus antri]